MLMGKCTYFDDAHPEGLVILAGMVRLVDHALVARRPSSPVGRRQQAGAGSWHRGPKHSGASGENAGDAITWAKSGPCLTEERHRKETP
jgi:hypothetical protein